MTIPSLIFHGTGCTSRHLLWHPFVRFRGFKLMTKSCFYETKENVPSGFKQYTHQGNASNLLQSYFGSPPWKELESGIAPLVQRCFDPACCGLIQLPPSHVQSRMFFCQNLRSRLRCTHYYNWGRIPYFWSFLHFGQQKVYNPPLVRTWGGYRDSLLETNKLCGSLQQIFNHFCVDTKQ